MLQAAAEPDELAAVVSEGAQAPLSTGEIEEFDGIGPGGRARPPHIVVKTAAIAVFSSTAPPPKLTDLVTRIDQPL